MRIFDFIGGVPKRCVFDNGTGIGRKVMDGVKLTELFSRFELHYGFEAAFCNPDSGHEKGNVENKVGTLRRNLLVPIPNVHDIDEYNMELLNECMKLAGKIHYRKGERSISLFEGDTAHLMPLPEKPFSCIRYDIYKVDKVGNVCISGKHRYSVAPALCGSDVIVGFGANTVDIHDERGNIIATHRRLYSEGPAESIDAAASLRLLISRPGAWPNSQARLSMPEELRNHIDDSDIPMLKEYLSTIAQAADETDYHCAIEAAYMVCHSTGQLKRSDVSIYAARLCYGESVVYDEAVDLSGYDAVFEGREALF
jgi:hypothetical protein